MSARHLLIALLLCAPLLVAEGARPRTSKTVRKEQRENVERMRSTKGQIQSTAADIRRQLARYETLDAKVAESAREVRRLNRRVDSLSRETRRIADSVVRTEARIEALRKSLASSLRNIRRQRQTASSTAFIFSASSFEQARRRMRYLKELSSWESETARDLKKEAALLEVRKARLDSVRKVREADLAEVRARTRQLEQDRLESKDLVDKLKGQSRRLEEVLTEQQERARRLDDELNRIIEEEARKAAEEERRRQQAAEEERRRRQAAEEARLKKAREDSIAAAKEQKKKNKKKKKDRTPVRKDEPSATTPVQPQKPVQVTPVRPKDEPVASDFASAKGRLPMPVSGPAVIVSDFGRHTHRQLSKVEVQNNGIDIETTAGASAVAVYPGVVSMVIVMDGYNNVVLVRHGEYLTVYAGISDLNVRKGQTVSQGQALGRIYSDPADDNRTRLHFEVRHEKDKLNPAEWLR